MNQVDDKLLLEKIDNTVREYNYLLTSQLEEQRKYYEAKVRNYCSSFVTDLSEAPGAERERDYTGTGLLHGGAGSQAQAEGAGGVGGGEGRAMG